MTPVAPAFLAPDQDPLSQHCCPCAAAVTQSNPLHCRLLSHACSQAVTVVAGFPCPLATFVSITLIQRWQAEHTHVKYSLNHFRTVTLLYAMAILFSVCVFVRLFVCRQRVLVGHRPDCPPARVLAAVIGRSADRPLWLATARGGLNAA